MYDEKELEDFYDEFLGLDGDMFLESDLEMKKLDNDLVIGNIDLRAAKIPSNYNNNNFLGDADGGILVDKPNVSIQLDLLNQNFISLSSDKLRTKSKSPTGVPDLRTAGGTLIRFPLTDKKVDEVDNELKDVDEKLTSPVSPVEKNSFHRVGWDPETIALWHSGPSSLNLSQPSHKNVPYQDLSSSVTYVSHGPQPLSGFSSSKRTYSHQQLGAKVEMVYSLLSMLDTDNREDMSKTFLAMSSSPESCHAMRQSGCLPLLIQLIYSSELDKEVRNRAAEALHNIVYAQTDEKRRKREVRVLKLLQQVREYCDELKNNSAHTENSSTVQETDKHPINATGTLMKLSFDAEHRQAICILGGLHAITDLIQVDHEIHGSTNNDNFCITLRRYAGMSLTNLTFGDGKNKALLCSFSKFLLALVDQLKSPSEDLRQVTASVLRNLSWRADIESKQALRNVSAVTALTISAMEAKKESTLKSILSALWNLSAHCSLNKIDICSVPGALVFLVKMLKYTSTSNTLSIIENAGGILRNISSHIAVREDYRQVLRDNYCFEVLLEQLKSPSLTIVSNACGTLWNLSARCPEDQRRLWEMGATSMLRSLVQSKHKMISMGSSAALKNLLAANPNENLLTHLDSTAKSLGLQNLPTLFVRKKRALEQELNITLAETCDNIEPVSSSFHFNKLEDKKETNNTGSPRRSDSHDSVKSSQSDTVYELQSQRAHVSEDKVLDNSTATLHDSLDEKLMYRKAEDQTLIKRFATTMIPTPTSKKTNHDRINEKAREEKPVSDDIKGFLSKTEIKEHTRPDLKQRNKKGIPVLRSKPKKAMIQDDVSHERSSSTKSHEERVFDNGERVRLDGENTVSDSDNCPVTAGTVSDSQNNIKSSNFKKNITEESDNVNESYGKCSLMPCKEHFSDGTDEENRKKQVADPFSAKRDEAGLTRKNSPLTIAPIYKTNFENCDNNFNLNSSMMGVTEHRFCENKLSSHEYSENPKRIIKSVPDDLNSVTKEPFSSDLPIGRIVQNSAKGFPLKENSKELLFAKRNTIPSTFIDQNTQLDNSQLELTETSLSELKLCDRKARYGGCGDTQMPSLHPSAGLSAFNDSHKEMNNSVSNMESESSFLASSGVHGSPSVTNESPCSFQVNETEDTFDSFKMPFNEDFSEKLNNINVDEVCAKSSACVFPKFKVGSPMTDPRVLQMEARKLCREIQKDHDFEMGCSLISEASLVSCSSFLDTGDYSLFECSTDTMNFDESEMVKAVPNAKNHYFSKSSSQAVDSASSLPSLGSLKNEQIEALDLDNSVLSVASITSEIDENYAKDHAYFSCCTKTYEVDARNEFPEEVSADATVVSRDEDTLNAEFIDDDNSLHSQENLPLDIDAFQEENSDRTRRKLTPKEKRKTFHERYRTYTIRDFKASDGTGKGPIVDDQDKNDLDSTTEAEVEVSNCYTQDGGEPSFTNGTWNQYNVALGTELYAASLNRKSYEPDLPSTTLLHERGHEPAQFSRSFDKERDPIPGLVFDSRSLNDLLSIGPSERKELVDNAKLVAFSLKTAVQDWEADFVSDSEADEPHKSSDIDTATYTKTFRDRAHTRLSLQELQSLQSFKEPLRENAEKIGAKICKPKNKGEDETEELSRGIRGRRKPLYSSPQKNTPKTKDSSSNASSAKMVPGTVDSKNPSLQQATTCQSPVLNREGTFTKEDGSVVKKGEGKNFGIIPAPSRNFESKNSIRLSGKNKLASSPKNSKAVRESKISKIGRPLSTYTSKASDKRTETDSSQRRPFSAGAGNRTSGEGIVAAKKPAPSILPSQKMKNSSSSQNVKAGTSPTNGCSIKPRNFNSQSGKSENEASLNVLDFRDKAGKVKTSKKEVTSKIASLWRKVEETKEKNKNLKDTRIWIEPERNLSSNEALVMEKEEILHIPTRTIVHSFTCHALSEETLNDFTHQERNSKNWKDVSYSGSTEEAQDKIQKRNIISAVVTPYNYNPPVSVATPSGFEEVENFQKSSLKITTV